MANNDKGQQNRMPERRGVYVSTNQHIASFLLIFDHTIFSNCSMTFMVSRALVFRFLWGL